MRLRLTVRTWPRRGLYLTDTPRPTCPACRGAGGWQEDYIDSTGDYGGSEQVRCDCWTARRRLLLPLPRIPRPRRESARAPF